MADHRTRAKAPLPMIESSLPMAALPRDNETKVDVGPKLVSIRDLQVYVSAALTNRMQTVWGVFTAIQTGTDTQNSMVYIYKADPLDPTSVQVNRSGNQNAANFSLAIPLQKLNLRPTPDHQWDIIPSEMIVPDGPQVFVLDLKARNPVLRNLAAEEAEAGGGKESGTTASTPTKVTAAGAQGSSKPLDPAKEARVQALREQIGTHEEQLSKLYAELDGAFEQ